MKDANLDQNSARFNVKTVEGLTYEFDIATTELIAPEVVPIVGERQPISLKCFGTIIFLFGLVLLTLRRTK